MTIEQLQELLNKIPASAIITIFTVAIALVVLYIVGMWRIFEKAGENGWKCLIPFYNQYTMYKMFWKTKYFWIVLVLSIANVFFNGLALTIPALSTVVSIISLVAFVFAVFLNYRISASFGHGIGYCIGLLLLPFIFTLILGFNQDEYYEYQFS